MPKSTYSLPGSSHFSILITQMGGLGDLVLTARLLSSLRDNFAGAALLLVCRTPFATVCELFPVPPDRVIALDFSPYDWATPSDRLFAELEPVLRQVSGLRADLFIAAEYQPTWFAWLLAAALQPQRAIYATNARPPGDVLAGVLERLDLDRVDFEGPTPPQDLHENQRYDEIVRFLDGVPRPTGRWIFPEPIDPSVQETLRALQLRSGEYLVCFPLGAAGIPVKRWPADRFIQALQALRQLENLPVLFVGDQSEADDLHRIANALGEEDVFVYAGSAEALPVLAGLILNSRAYLGNDTGPMHLASAYGVSGVAIYGGGHWPVYGPWGPGSVAIVSPLPCFGCDWDCLFGHGICVETIPVESVVEAMRAVLASAPAEPGTVVVDDFRFEPMDLIRDANKRYREAELDRGERLSSIIALRRNVDSSDGRLKQLEQTAADRLAALEAQHTAIEALRKESDRRRQGMDEIAALLDLRDSRIEEVEAVLRQRVADLESQGASYNALQIEADLRNAGLLQLTSEIALRDRRIQELGQIAVERLEALHAADLAYQALQVEADRRIRELERMALERLEALHAADLAYQALQMEADRRTAGMVELTAQIAARDEIVQSLTGISEERQRSLEELDKHVQLWKHIASERLAGVQILTAQVAQWEQTAEDRLQALQFAEAILRTAAETAATRIEGMERDFHARVEDLQRECDQRLTLLESATQALAGQRTISEERLSALLVTDNALQAVRADSELRLACMNELTAAIATRDGRIAELEQQVREREVSLQDAAARIAKMLSGMEQLEQQASGFQRDIVALNRENLYNFFVRRTKNLLPDRTPPSSTE